MRLHKATLLLTTTTFSTTKPSLSFGFTSIPTFTSSLTKLHQPLTTASSLFQPTSFRPYFHTARSIRTKRKMYRSTSTTATTTGNKSGSSSKKVALLQFKVSSSKLQNQERVKELIDSTMKQNPDIKLIVLPEIWNGPYATNAFPEFAEIFPPVNHRYLSNQANMMRQRCPSARVLFEAAIEHGVYIVGGSMAERENDKIYNTCLCISPNGTLVAKHRKAHLFDIDVKGGITFKESDTLTGGDTVTGFDTGDDLFGYIGVGICYDIRFPEYALLLNQRYRCNLLVYPGAFNLTTGPAHWEILQRGRAVDNQCFVLTASPARTDPPRESGKYPHYTAWGHSTVVNPWGEVIATCDEKENVVVADLNMNEVTQMRQGIPTFSQRRHDLYKVVDVTNAEKMKQYF